MPPVHHNSSQWFLKLKWLSLKTLPFNSMQPEFTENNKSLEPPSTTSESEPSIPLCSWLSVHSLLNRPMKHRALSQKSHNYWTTAPPIQVRPFDTKQAICTYNVQYHANVSYLSNPKIHSHQGHTTTLETNQLSHEPNIFNGPLLNLATLIGHVMMSATEATIAAIFSQLSLLNELKHNISKFHLKIKRETRKLKSFHK